tara:strand:+ start:560 stop:838 length:279 start_codon:yes stop_codon:yes gene_type:complete
MNDEDRLERIDRMLTDMSGQFNKIVRLEEKHLALSDKVSSIGGRIHKHANIIMELQNVASLNTKSVGQFEKLAYMLVGSIFAAVSYFVFEKL